MIQESLLETPKKSKLVAAQLLSPFAVSNVQKNTSTDDLSGNPLSTAASTPAGLYWTFNPMEDHPPRYVPQRATPASVHASSNRLTDSLQLSLLDLTRAPTSTSANPINLGKRAILALLSGEELMQDTCSRLSKLESAVSARAQHLQTDGRALMPWIEAHRRRDGESAPDTAPEGDSPGD